MQEWCFLRLSDARIALRKMMVAFIDEEHKTKLRSLSRFVVHYRSLSRILAKENVAKSIQLLTRLAKGVMPCCGKKLKGYGRNS
jgi:hypothetical protein